MEQALNKKKRIEICSYCFNGVLLFVLSALIAFSVYMFNDLRDADKYGGSPASALVALLFIVFLIPLIIGLAVQIVLLIIGLVRTSKGKNEILSLIVSIIFLQEAFVPIASFLESKETNVPYIIIAFALFIFGGFNLAIQIIRLRYRKILEQPKSVNKEQQIIDE